jgi:hypothetical protein
MPAEAALSSVAHIIQLAVAPVFLLTGIASLLGVTTNRLSRVVDRTRTLSAEGLDDADGTDPRRVELATLFRRAALVSRSITLFTITALLVCGVVALLFIGHFVGPSVSVVVALLFVTAMFTLIVGLLCFLREILLSATAIEERAKTTLEHGRK